VRSFENTSIITRELGSADSPKKIEQRAGVFLPDHVIEFFVIHKSSIRNRKREKIFFPGAFLVAKDAIRH
jgi:hypothetical protein